jgi:hypothetical protein
VLIDRQGSVQRADNLLSDLSGDDGVPEIPRKIILLADPATPVKW